jgi:hypothetical protein
MLTYQTHIQVIKPNNLIENKLKINYELQFTINIVLIYEIKKISS